LQDYGISQGSCWTLAAALLIFPWKSPNNPVFNVIGIDVDSDAVTIANANIHKAGLEDRLSVEKGDVQQMRFQDGAFD